MTNGFNKFISIFFIYILFSFTIFTDVKASDDSYEREHKHKHSRRSSYKVKDEKWSTPSSSSSSSSSEDSDSSSSDSERYSRSKKRHRSSRGDRNNEKVKRQKVTHPSHTRMCARKSENVEMNNWMGHLSGNKKISELSIPGTHESCALHDAASFRTSIGLAKCQDNNLEKQLEDGIRFLDIRCRHMKGKYRDCFTIHHGVVYQNIDFKDVINYCSSFLKKNRKEFIIMSVKEEYDPDERVSRSFKETFFDEYYKNNKSIWFIGKNIPKINDVRGKIVLLRRFGGTLGINLTSWDDNDFTNEDNYSIQDKYKIDSIDSKFNNVKKQIESAKSGKNDKLYINFLSGYSLLLPHLTPLEVARGYLFADEYHHERIEGVNKQLLDYLPEEKCRIGIIPMDFYDKDLAKKIINLNEFM